MAPKGWPTVAFRHVTTSKAGMEAGPRRRHSGGATTSGVKPSGLIALVMQASPSSPEKSPFSGVRDRIIGSLRRR